MPSFKLDHPLPSLPTETYAHILSFCDNDTLGRASLVSLAFLELAAPHLYGHITITGLAQLDKLFYQEERVSSAPHLDRLLSLDQTRAFTFIGTPQDEQQTITTSEGMSRIRLFSPKRTTSSYPIRVETFSALFHNPGEHAHRAVDQIIPFLFLLFDPTHATLASSTPLKEDPFSMSLQSAPWTSLRSLSLSDIDVQAPLCEVPFFGRLAPSSLIVTVDLSLPEERCALRGLLIDDLARDDDGWLSPDWPQVKEVVVKVRSQAQKEDVLLDIRREGWDSSLGVGMGEKERDRREAMIRFVGV